MRDLATLPKAHLHLHAESAVRWTTLREIGAANGVAVPDHLSDGAFAFTDFAHFAVQNALVRECLRRPEDFERIALEFCQDEAAQGVGYAEVSFTAAAHGERLGKLEMPLEALLRGLAAGQAAYGIECRVLLDHSRRRPLERAWRTLELARRYAAHGVVGMGLAGDESYPLAPFHAVCDAAREAGLHLVHHAGEFHGPDSIREALHVGHAERIGHGIRILDDPALVAEVRERAIPLEVCPTSNVALGFAPSFREHPIPRLRDASLIVTLNTDIPNVIGTDLTTEYARVRDAFGYSDAALTGFARASIDSSFAPAATKARLHSAVNAWLASPAT